MTTGLSSTMSRQNWASSVPLLCTWEPHVTCRIPCPHPQTLGQPRQIEYQGPREDTEYTHKFALLTSNQVFFNGNPIFILLPTDPPHLVRLGGYMVNLSDFYSYRLIGKLTAFLQLQEFSLRKHNVECSTTVAWLSLPTSKVKLV
jgi:hypothetical protein